MPVLMWNNEDTLGEGEMNDFFYVCALSCVFTVAH